MKVPFWKKAPTLHEMIVELDKLILEALADPQSELRQLFARVARGEAKNFFALHIGTELEKFERELQQRRERALAELGSAGPALSSAAPTLDREVRRAITRLENEHRKVLYTLPEKAVCWNSACSTQDPVPHMLDERDHRTIGEVDREERAARALPTCTPDKPCNLLGHDGEIDPTQTYNVLDLCPKAKLAIPVKGVCGDQSPLNPLPCGLPAGHTGHHRRGEREWDSRYISHTKENL